MRAFFLATFFTVSSFFRCSLLLNLLLPIAGSVIRAEKVAEAFLVTSFMVVSVTSGRSVAAKPTQMSRLLLTLVMWLIQRGENVHTWEWVESFAAGGCYSEGGRDGAFPSEM